MRICCCGELRPLSETGDLETGRKYINKIRERAKNTQHVKLWDDQSQDAANYKVGDLYRAI